MNGIKRESKAPTQGQVAHQQDPDIPYKVKYRCKFCEMLWLDKLALFFQILAIFSTFLVLKLLQKWSLKIQTIVTNQWKATGLAMLPEVYVESEICHMDVKFVKKMSLAYAGYISKIFTPFPPF